MKTITTAMKALLASNAYSLATCWQITRQDGVVMGFTDWTDNITVGSVTYLASTGYSRTAVDAKADLSIPNLETQGILSSGEITDADIQAGRYDFAQLYVFMMVPTDTNAATYGTITLRNGLLGQMVTIDGSGEYQCEVRGLSQYLVQELLEIYTLGCKADLGDTRCKLDLTTFTDTGTVTGVSVPSLTFAATLSTSRTSGYHALGVLTWTGGLNNGLSMEVKTFDGINFTLYLPMGYAVQTGDTFSVHAGCDKAYSTCINKFNNVINHRGFPWIPGLDLMLYPNAALQYPQD